MALVTAMVIMFAGGGVVLAFSAGWTAKLTQDPDVRVGALVARLADARARVAALEGRVAHSVPRTKLGAGLLAIVGVTVDEPSVAIDAGVATGSIVAVRPPTPDATPTSADGRSLVTEDTSAPAVIVPAVARVPATAQRPAPRAIPAKPRSTPRLPAPSQKSSPQTPPPATSQPTPAPTSVDTPTPAPTPSPSPVTAPPPPPPVSTPPPSEKPDD